MTALRKTDAPGKVIPIRREPDLAAAYRATISVHYPNSDPLSLDHRVNIMALRDRASAGLRRCGPEAHAILAEAARIATFASLANADARELGFTRVAIESLIFAADMMRRGHA